MLFGFSVEVGMCGGIFCLFVLLSFLIFVVLPCRACWLIRNISIGTSALFISSRSCYLKQKYLDLQVSVPKILFHGRTLVGFFPIVTLSCHFLIYQQNSFHFCFLVLMLTKIYIRINRNSWECKQIRRTRHFKVLRSLGWFFLISS